MFLWWFLPSLFPAQSRSTEQFPLTSFPILSFAKLEVMDVAVNKPLNSYVREAYENFMIGKA